MPFKDLSQQELSLLAKVYADPILKDVNYRQLYLDVNDIIASKQTDTQTIALTMSRGVGRTRFLPHQYQSFRLKSDEPPSENLIERFATHVREQKVRIRDFFQ